jgi:hypothetical protein
MQSSVRRLLAALILAGAPTLLYAYGVRIHALLPAAALGDRPVQTAITVAREELPGVTDADLAGFRLAIWTRASQLPDTAVRGAFVRRYPTAASFTPAALKELLMMSGHARVLGIDSFASVYRAMTRHDRSQDPHRDYIAGQPILLGTALQLGSIYPDLDRRNQTRIIRAPDGSPLRTASGDSVPFDPMTLNMGRMTGLSSQAHAHLGLSREPKSADPATLKTEPWNFAIATGFPGPVESYGPDNAQIYADLAVLAALDGRPGLRALGALYLGNSMHYIADVGNAVHTIQVGIYPIFFDATLQAWLRRALTLFGLLGTAPSRNAIGIDIITNLHSMSERLFEAQLTSAIRAREAGQADSIPPSMQSSLRALGAGDDSLGGVIAGRLREAGDNPDFGRVIAYAVVDANVRDGAEVYRVTRDIIDTRLRIGRIAMDFDTVPDRDLWRYVRVHRGAVIHTQLDDFNAVHARGVARTVTALRGLWAQYLEATNVDGTRRHEVANAIVTRLVSERLRYLAAAETRRAQWIASHGGLAR